jgi:hypothetical protein
MFAVRTDPATEGAVCIKIICSGLLVAVFANFARSFSADLRLKHRRR